VGFGLTGKVAGAADAMISALEEGGFPNDTRGEAVYGSQSYLCNGVEGECASSSSSSSSTGAAEQSSSSSSTGPVPVRRRLLQVVTQGQTTKVQLTLQPGQSTDPTAAKTASFLGAVLRCGTDQACANAAASSAGFKPLNISASIIAAVIPGSVAIEDGQLTGGEVTGAPTVSPNGDSRRTNGGYYFLAAVLALFILIALIYFAVHKAPAAEFVKKDARHAQGAELAPVVAAPAAASGVVAQDESAPLGAAGQPQMDYRSVFALKNNVLAQGAEQKNDGGRAGEEDVHFILHQ
jgi:hypothetical protein